MNDTIEIDFVEPKIYVIARQCIDRSALKAFLIDQEAENWQSSSEIPAQEVAEIAGRLCYNSFNKPRPGGNKAYLEHIIEVGHGSVLQHAVWSFLITGVSRSFSLEWNRHSTGTAVSQASQRYIDESESKFVLPQPIADDPLLADVFSCSAALSLRAYKRFVKELKSKSDNESEPQSKTDVNKKVRQAARSILPNAIETKLFWTANARAIRNILEQRASRFAEPEIRKVANLLYETMLLEAPDMFGDYSKFMLPDGTYELTTCHKKV